MAELASNFSTTRPAIDYKITERSIPIGFDHPGIIFDYHLMPLTSQVRNCMLISKLNGLYFNYDLKTITA